MLKLIVEKQYEVEWAEQDEMQQSGLREYTDIRVWVNKPWKGIGQEAALNYYSRIL
jgi:hypothetical protein